MLIIAPAATAFALMVGITLGLPAGYYGGRIDSILSFLANLVLAFPVILLFYLLVTPGIMDTPIPYALAGLFFLFPIIFFCVLFYTRFKNRPDRLYILLGLTLVLGGWVYIGLVFDADPLGIVSIEPNQLNIFVAVVFASSPGVFRIVRGLVMDIKTRDYVAAAQTRGESALVHHAVGNPAQRARAADRRCLPAHRLHDDPARHARLFRPRPGAGKPGLGHGDQGRRAACCAPSSIRRCRRRSR